MHTSHRCGSGEDRIEGPRSYHLITFAVLFVIFVTGAACAGPARGRPSADERDASLRQIAAAYAQDGDLAQAQSDLADLQLANPGQVLLLAAEQNMQANRPQAETEQLAQLASALGVRSPQLVAYLAPKVTPTPQPTLVPLVATETPLPPPTERPTVPPSITPAIVVTSTSTPLAAGGAARPHVVAAKAVNLRSGPSTGYPVIGQLKAGQEADIVARNASGDWWQLVWDSGNSQAWVAGTIITVLGPIDTVAIAAKIPAPPPTATPRPTATPGPTAPPPPPTQPPQPAIPFIVKSLRLRPLGVDGQACHGGNLVLAVKVQDPAGNGLDGVRIRNTLTNVDIVTGSQGKGPGMAEFIGNGRLQIINENNEPQSDLTRGMNVDWPDFDLLRDAGYCSCGPFDDATCEAHVLNHDNLFAARHFSYDVVFQRTY